MAEEYDASFRSSPTVYPADMISEQYSSGFNNWSNWGNGPMNPARAEKDITEVLD